MSKSINGHEALHGLTTEQIADLAVLGLRYRNLGGRPIDFSRSDWLEPYWTGQALVAREVARSIKAGAAGLTVAAIRQRGMAEGYINALLCAGLIDNDFYMSSYKRLPTL